MLWDVDLYKIVAGLSLLMITAVMAGMVWIVFRRAAQGWHARRWKEAKGLYQPVIASLIGGKLEGNLEALRRPPHTVEWETIEKLLLDRVKTSSGEQQRRTTEAFEALGYVDFYLKRLKSNSLWKRLVAAQRLGVMRSNRAIPDLLKALEDRDRDVRQTALQSLGRMQDPQALRRLAKKLNEVSRQDNGLSRRLLMAALIPYGDKAVPFLAGKLSDASDAVRALAAEILGEIPSPRAVRGLMVALKDQNPEVRAKAASALGRIGHPLTVKPLIVALSDPFWYVRVQAARALGRLKSPQGIYALLLRLTDSHAQVRRAAAEALIQIGPAALSALTIHLLYTRDRYAREQVSNILQQSGLIHRWIDSLDEREEAARKQAAGLLIAVAQSGSLNVLIGSLGRHSKPQVRLQLLDILSRSGRLPALRAIRRTALHDPDPEVRERAKDIVHREIKNKKHSKENNVLGDLCHQS